MGRPRDTGLAVTWLGAVGPILGGLGSLLGAVNGWRVRQHRRRLDQLERRQPAVRVEGWPAPKLRRPPLPYRTDGDA